MDWLARGLEVLADEGRHDAASLCFDVVIVGSGYGGAVTAARLARLRRADGGRLRIVVLERGREYVPGEFPNDLGMLPGAVRVDRADGERPIGRPDALFHVHVDRDINVLTGSALGGTSQINANVAIEADADVFRSHEWPRAFREVTAPLAECYARARETLGVVDYPGDVTKARAFAAVAPHFEERHERDGDPTRPCPNGRLRRAPLAVRFAASDDESAPRNPAGVAQKACIECGDCVSGCNHWAKNTLTMNYLPLAQRRGVRMFTGATVQHLQPAPQGGWIVTVDVTTAETRPVRSERMAGAPLRLTAARVVLCAGALGSTEILMRSRAANGLNVSTALGQGFSTNGDMISAAYWQRDPVSAVGFGADAGQPRVGPTITSLVDLRDARAPDRRIVIEDGAVPGALGDVFAEVLATAALLPQRVRWRTQAQRHRDPDADPEGFGISDTATRHSQLLLSIGHDDARGVLALKDGRSDDGFRRVRIDWRGDRNEADVARAQRAHGYQAQLLRAVERRGAIHLDNPLWRPVPEEISSALGAGALPDGVQLTVHPLGGCRMADDVAHGVCNAQGEVFDTRSASSVHAGLFVCDGSIVPTALGANPFLTIAALAERSAALLVDHMVREEGLTLSDAMDPLPDAPQRQPAAPVVDRRVSMVFEERMRSQGDLLADVSGLAPVFGGRLEQTLRTGTSARAAPTRRDDAPFLALDVRLEIDDLRDYVRTFGRRSGARSSGPPRVSGQLKILQDRSDLLQGQDVDQLGDCCIELTNGRFDLFAETAEPALKRLARAGWAFLRLSCRHRSRPWGAHPIGSSTPTTTVRSPEPARASTQAAVTSSNGRLLRALGGLSERLSWVRVMINLLRHLGTARTIDYRFDLVGRDGRAYRLEGRKRLVFDDAVNPWLSVADLDVRIRARDTPGGVPIWSGRLRLDPLEIVQHKVPRVTREPHAPESIVQMASYGLLFARAILGTHLLQFRAPDYAPAVPFEDDAPTLPDTSGAPDAAPRRRRWPGRLAGLDAPERHRIPIDTDGQAPGLEIALTHYAPPAHADRSGRAPVMIFHGILHSTLAFATDTIDRNLVQALCDGGYDVWLVDFRTSIAFGDAPRALSFDQVARHDVPTAVNRVLDYSGASQVNVFAHCMGAAVFSMAMLARWVEPDKIRALVYCQVSFLVANAYGNRLRAEVSAFVRDALAFETINPRADASVGGAERLLDRVATTFPVPARERDAHIARAEGMPHDAATCNRLTLLIGRHWYHHNLDPRTHAALGELLGPSSIRTFFQIQHFGLRGRVMTALGDNAYVTDENIRDAFRNLPVLFIQGADSDVFDTRTTRLAHRKLCAVTGLAHRIILYPGYGHLECVIGRDAYRRVFPDVQAFFDAPPSRAGDAPSTVSDPPGHVWSAEQRGSIPTGMPSGEARVSTRTPASRLRAVVRAPWIGPIVGAAWPDPADPDRLLVRIWFAPDARVTETAWGQVEYRGALSHFAAQHARFTVIPWSRNARVASVVPSHVVRTIAFRRAGPSAVASGSDGAMVPDCVADEDCADEGMIVGTVGMSLGDPWGAHDGGADHVDAEGAMPATGEARDAGEADVESDGDVGGDGGAPDPWVDPPEAFLGRAVRLRAAQVAGLLQTRETAMQTRFLLASCRHPGNFFERDLADAAFGPMLREAEGACPATHALLVGDQVYADATANVFRTEQPAERWEALYRAAFDTPRMRDFLRQVPTLMVADDHEIEDDWAGVPPPAVADPILRAGRDAAVALERHARTAHQVFQWSHGAGAAAPGPGAVPHFWYATCIAGFDYFVLDCRFERRISDAGEAASMISQAQFTALEAWLAGCTPGRPCFLVSPSALWPVNDALLPQPAYARREDGWLRYPADAARLIRLLWRHPRRLVVLSGDAHCSFGARVVARDPSGHGCARFISIVSSALFAPYPFANEHPADYGLPGPARAHRIVVDGMRVDVEWQVEYTVGSPGYTVVEAERIEDGWAVRATARGSDGIRQAGATWT